MTVVAIAPHPDDELIGAGGSLIKHARAGRRVVIVQVVGRERGLGDTQSDEQYSAEIDQACALLGAQRCVRLGGASRDLLPSRELRLGLVRVLREERPEVVYVPHHDEADREHSLVNELACDAVWMASAEFFAEAGGEPAPPPRLVLGYEVWTPLSRYQYAEDIGEVIEDKATAMMAYRSQLRHVDWADAIRGLARYRGATASGSGYAEVFEVIRLDRY
jgi:LmbE family N-acetylglucosaminyl deacetylase